MGNRAVIQFGLAKPEYSDSVPGIYLHWNGGRASVQGFLEAGRLLGFNHAPDKYLPFVVADARDKLAKLCLMFFKGSSVHVGEIGRLETDNHDNGVFVINPSTFEIEGRWGAGSENEEINQAKTDFVFHESLANYAIASEWIFDRLKVSE